ncbi:zinc finger domain-containing protein [Bradyrhizobium sp. AZCC 2289]|uniref:zinc finger domain-containing protein n=1 Tax=Bradyrhizobium sp. AZCC 2289 TaxID=3117026 RepID=UPI003FA57CFF
MQCPNCKGEGIIVKMQDAVLGEPIKPNQPCPTCKGTGVVADPKPVRFKSRLAEARRRPRP